MSYDRDPLVIEPPGPNSDRHRDHRHQQLGQPDPQPRIDETHDEGDDDRANTDQQRRPVRLVDMLQRHPKPLEEMVVARAERMESQQVLDLV